MMHLTAKKLLANEDNFTFLSTFGFHRAHRKNEKERTKNFTPMTIKTKPPFSCSGTLLSAACQGTPSLEIIREMDGKVPDTSL